jgi:hypothetical protein
VWVDLARETPNFDYKSVPTEKKVFKRVFKKKNTSSLYLATYGGNATQSKFLCRHSSEQRQAIICRCSPRLIDSKSTTYTNTKIDDREKIQYSGTFRQRLGDFKLISCAVNNLSQQKLNQPLIAILKEFWDFLLFLPFLEQEYF